MLVEDNSDGDNDNNNYEHWALWSLCLFIFLFVHAFWALSHSHQIDALEFIYFIVGGFLLFSFGKWSQYKYYQHKICITNIKLKFLSNIFTTLLMTLRFRISMQSFGSNVSKSLRSMNHKYNAHSNLSNSTFSGTKNYENFPNVLS